MLTIPIRLVNQIMLPVRLISTGKALPFQCITSESLDIKLGHPIGYTFKKSGVLSRYAVLPNESQSQLGAEALWDALKNASLKVTSIDLLIAACGVQEQPLPSTACFIAANAGLQPGTPAFDVNASCLSFVVALRIAAALLATGSYTRIAVVSSDIASRGLDWSKPESSLFRAARMSSLTQWIKKSKISNEQNTGEKTGITSTLPTCQHFQWIVKSADSKKMVHVEPIIINVDKGNFMSVENTIIATGVVLWFAHGWYLNERLKLVHKKLDRVLESFDGLREYLYEIDPQFDDERESHEAVENGDSLFAGMNDMELLRYKSTNGKRTLNSLFVNQNG
jgi:hypothetical protein